MEGVTTAIVGFVFVCLVWPHLVKNKPQFYGALALVLVIILFDAIGHFSTEYGALRRVMYVLAALLQILAVLLLVLSAGGLTPRDLASEMGQTIETFRRGGEEKPILVPLHGDVPIIPKEDRLQPEPPSSSTATDSPSIPLE